MDYAGDSWYDAAIAGDADAIYELRSLTQYSAGHRVLNIQCEKGNTERVRFLVSHFADENLLLRLDEEKNNCLHIAASFGHSEVVEVLIESAKHLTSSASDNDDFQAFIRQANKDKYTPLHKAVLIGSAPVVKLLVEADRDYRHIQDCNGRSPMYIATQKGYSDIVKVLLTTCTALSFDGPHGIHALHLAAHKGDLEVVKLLVDADPSLSHVQYEEGETPMYVAAQNGNVDVVKLIGTNCTHLSFVGPNGETALHAAIKNMDQANENDSMLVEVILDVARHLPLTSAASNGSDNEVSGFHTLIRKADWSKNTALHKAVMNHNLAIVKILVEADPDDRHIRNNEGKTPIYIAAEEGCIDILKVLCSSCPNSSFVGPEGATALHAAIKDIDQGNEKDSDMVEFLIETVRPMLLASDEDSDDSHDQLSCIQLFVRQPDWSNNTALHKAVINGNVDIVKLLVEADPNHKYIQNDENKTPIYIAVEKGYLDIVKVICTTCTDLSFDGPKGSSVLHAAIKNLNQVKTNGRDVITELVNAAKHWSNSQDEPHGSMDALFYKTDSSGKTFLDMAVEGNYLYLVELILIEDPSDQRGRGSKSSNIKRLIHVAADKGYNDILQLLSETYETGISPDHKGLIDLLLAIRKRDTESVLSLLGDAKHLVTCADHEGWTPLHFAAYHEFDSILYDIVKAQEEVGFDYVYEEVILTPLHVAAKKGHTSTVIRLMQLWPASSFAYALVNDKGQNILHMAADQSKKEMIQGILKYCPEKFKDKILNVQDDKGDTPLHLLISTGCFIPELLKHKRLNIMEKNKQNLTPLDMFYQKKEIIADQVQIKIALDKIQDDQHWMFWRRNIQRKSNIQESDVLPSTRTTKDVEFNKAMKLFMNEKQKRMKEELERYKKRTNTQIIVTALITTVTFTVGFTMPGGLHQSGELDQGLVILSNKRAFNAFMVSDVLALLLSTCSLFLYFLESMYEDPQQVSKLNAASTVLNIVSVMAMMLTFITGTYVVLSHTLVLAITVCFIGSLFFLLIIVLLIKMVYDRQVETDEE